MNWRLAHQLILNRPSFLLRCVWFYLHLSALNSLRYQEKCFLWTHISILLVSSIDKMYNKYFLFLFWNLRTHLNWPKILAKYTMDVYVIIYTRPAEHTHTHTLSINFGVRRTKTHQWAQNRRERREEEKMNRNPFTAPYLYWFLYAPSFSSSAGMCKHTHKRIRTQLSLFRFSFKSKWKS